jgi:uncharacterized protein (DUF2249 family)
MSNRPGEHTSGSSPAASLPDEHAVLRQQVTTRAELVLREADEGRWPTTELTALVDYLHLEVLRQIVDEEWLLYRTARHAPDELARLRGGHLELRLGIDTLTQAAVGDRTLSPAQLAAAVRDLLAHLDAHMAAEEKALSIADTAPPSVASLGVQPHEWYPLTEGPVIELDRLPGPRGADAALDRLLQLRPGESVELHATADPGPLCQRVRRSDPGGWGVTNLEQGPPRWRVEIVRRPPEPPLSPAAG